MSNESRDMNRDPITGKPGSHPVGTAVGGAGGAAAGAFAGSLFGPIGTLIGGTVGAVAGGGAGHAAAEQINPTGELEYWREACVDCDYYDPQYDYDRDYAPAYHLGWEARTKYRDRDWDDRLEAELKGEWSEFKRDSQLAWEKAKLAARDAFHRADRTYGAYDATDAYFEDRLNEADYYVSDYEFSDYRPAYHLGTYARTRYEERDWDDRLENELESEWAEFKGESRLAWEKAKHATRDAWHSVERTIPGDFDNDGR